VGSSRAADTLDVSDFLAPLEVIDGQRIEQFEPCTRLESFEKIK
jgi:hypothetical protein